MTRIKYNLGFLLPILFLSLYSNAQSAVSNFILPSNQCLPVYLDGRPCTNETLHFIEIFEIATPTSTWVLGGTYYSAWHSGQIGEITDLGAYTGYQFQNGRHYRIKVAVQNSVTGWNESVNVTTINDMATCLGPNRSLTPFYDKDGKCIIGFAAGPGCSTHDLPIYSDYVVFNVNGNIFVDNQPSYFYHLNGGPYFGNVSVTFHYKDGTTNTSSMTYEKCPPVVMDPHDGELTHGKKEKGEANEILINSQTKVFPTPSNGIFTVSTGNSSIQLIKIFDSLGKEIINRAVTGTRSLEFDLSNHPKGIYFIHILDENDNVEIKKQLIQ